MWGGIFAPSLQGRQFRLGKNGTQEALKVV